ncbi:hypothetical protein [Anaerosporobacter sp.]|uniref:hypothetical protein n=1 Tax=Anaerosporobacter sp. TaxID=1872529 RepID=UPI00286EFED0|nr:hypothetical protein [Anaerosporobacter sp.]
MERRNDKIHYKLFRIDQEYYTFISGALISIPLTLLFEIVENYSEVAFWIGLIMSIFTSFFCFRLSIILKDVNETYQANKQGVGDIVIAWNNAIDRKKTSCITFLILTIMTLICTVICIFLMQFIDSSSTANVENTVSQVESVQPILRR